MLITYIHFYKLLDDENVDIQKMNKSETGAPLAKFDETSGRTPRPESVNLVELVKSYEKSCSGKQIFEEIIDPSKKVELFNFVLSMFLAYPRRTGTTFCNMYWKSSRNVVYIFLVFSRTYP